MTQILIVIGFFLAAFSLMLVSLHFAKYKKRPSGCCGAGNCDTDDKESINSCYSEKKEFVEKYNKESGVRIKNSE